MDKKISNLSQLAYIKRYVLTDGKENGIKVVEIDNGKIRLTLNESKALDIMQLWYNGKNFAFISKNGFSGGNNHFLKRFEGGFLYTVGLDSAGIREGYELHGSFHNIPAKVISCVINEDKIEVVGEIEDTQLFGKNLKVIRKYLTDILSNRIVVQDTIINNGTRDEQYCTLYHCNFGYPFLDENVIVSFDGKMVLPRTELAKEHVKDIHKFFLPVDNQEERCYFIKNATPVIVLSNTKTKERVKLSYSDDTIPKMVLWQSNATNDYALGIEPTTTFLDDNFEYKTIKKGEKITNKIEIEFN